MSRKTRSARPGPQAAEQGLVTSQFNLAVHYATGSGLPKDMSQAVHWYLLAAEQHHAKAMYNLSIAYERGEGVTRDLVEAAMWVRLAAKSGHEQAAKSMAQVDAKLRPDEIADANRRTALWLKTNPKP